MIQRNVVFSLLIAGLFCFALSAPAAAADKEGVSLEDSIVEEKCSLCHSSKRLMMMDPDRLRPTLERMQKKNPDWITNIEREHIAKALAEVLKDKSLLATRKAWQEAVDRGEVLFGDPEVGSNGKACTDCHAKETMKQVSDGYPQYDLKVRRVVSFEDRVRLMVKNQLEGETSGPEGQKILDLIAYLKSLY